VLPAEGHRATVCEASVIGFFGACADVILQNIGNFFRSLLTRIAGARYIQVNRLTKCTVPALSVGFCPSIVA
jgi:hypothetical protein